MHFSPMQYATPFSCLTPYPGAYGIMGNGFTRTFDAESQTWRGTKLVDFHGLSPIKNVDFLHLDFGHIWIAGGRGLQ
jgi:hypothetical protein